MPARDVLLELGYEPLERFGEFPTDHLPAMVRKANWQWRGDYYDPEIPLSVDLHFRFWDEGTERIGAPGIGMFWERRVSFDGGGMACALHHCDALAYHALHLLRHLLRGDIRLSHAWELGYFLHLHASDCGFWRMWRDLHPPELRRLQAVCFRLAEEWFGCDMAAAAREEIRQLPGPVQTWFERYSCAPIDALTRPNKHELWLHMALLETWRDRRTVLRRRLLPARLPGPVDSPLVAESQLSRTARLHRRLRYAVHVASRACHHLRLLPPAIRDGAMWLLRDSRG